MIDQTAQAELEEEEDHIPGLPDPAELLRLQRAMAAQESCRAAGGDDSSIDALAVLRAQVIEGITLYANPPATYCALQRIKAFWAEDSPEDSPEDESAEMDRLISMVYCFAEPLEAYLFARRGADAFFEQAFHWASRHFPGQDASYRLGRAAGWCMGILQTLEALNPQTPVAPLIPVPAPAEPPAPMQDSSPP